jgi:putative ABC transport system permease protein
MILLTFRDLLYRKTRFIVVTLLSAVVFALLFVMTGLVEQFNLEPYDTVDAIGAETWVVAEGISGPFTSGSLLPATTVDAVNSDDSAPAVVARSSVATDDGPEEVFVIGHVIGDVGTPEPASGRAASARGELVADSTAGLAVGEEVLLAGEPFTVVGETENTTVLAGIPLVFLPIEDAQALVFGSDEVISVVLADGPVDSAPDGTSIMTADEVAEDVLGPLEGAIASVDLVRVLLWIVAGIIIGAVVYLSALDRQRDFAVLKAIGAADRSLLASLAIQAVLVALVAVGVAAIIQIFLAPAFPLKVRVPARAFWQLPLMAVVMSLIAGAVGMRQVMRADPSQAFAGAA